MAAPSVTSTDRTLTLSARQVEPLLTARNARRGEVMASADLGVTRQRVELTSDGVKYQCGGELSWDQISKIGDDPGACWLIANERMSKIHAFSEEMQRPCSLLATDSAPTLIIGGFTMHRIKRSDPRQDTLAKIRAASPLGGRVLDTTTGLGYTAIEAARVAEHVTTIEIDPTVLEIARLNPWSRELFTNECIKQMIGNASEVIEDFPDAYFDGIIHDPPSLSLAGELYSGEFYQQLHRVLRRDGHVFHYLGNPESKQGSMVTRGAIKRLREAGFQQIRHDREAFGVVAFR